MAQEKAFFLHVLCARITRNLHAIFAGTPQLDRIRARIAQKGKMLWGVRGERTSMHDEMERLVLLCERGRTHTTTTFDRAAFSRVLPGKQHAYGALVITRFRCSLICTSGEGKAQG